MLWIVNRDVGKMKIKIGMIVKSNYMLSTWQTSPGKEQLQMRVLLYNFMGSSSVCNQLEWLRQGSLLKSQSLFPSSLAISRRAFTADIEHDCFISTNQLPKVHKLTTFTEKSPSDYLQRRQAFLLELQLPLLIPSTLT